MVSVAEAKAKIRENVSRGTTEVRGIRQSLGYVLSEDVKTPISLPPFRQSSMDGYAVRHEDITEPNTVLRLAGESRAGSGAIGRLEAGTAMRIFTGAPVPEGATAVVMQEHTGRTADGITFQVFPVEEGWNVRRIGQQVTAGDVALRAGSLLTPGSIGLLLSMNVCEVEVYTRPKVGLLVTGDELVPPGQPLAFGQIYESNSAMLAAALELDGIAEVDIRFSSDNLEATIQALRQLAAENDIVLATGGISVGDYDFVGAAVAAIGASTVFYKVKQKPGKPLLFAKAKDTLFFALPGNPASSLVCYYEYVRPALRQYTGFKELYLPAVKMPVSQDYRFSGERDEFLRAYASDDEVVPLEGQESFLLRSFAAANALIYLPTNQHTVKKGDMVQVHLLPLR